MKLVGFTASDNLFIVQLLVFLKTFICMLSFLQLTFALFGVII